MVSVTGTNPKSVPIDLQVVNATHNVCNVRVRDMPVDQDWLADIRTGICLRYRTCFSGCLTQIFCEDHKGSFTFLISHKPHRSRTIDQRIIMG
jgi:hypothetical protein